MKEFRRRGKADGVLVYAPGSTGTKQSQSGTEHLARPLAEHMVCCIQELYVALKVINNEALHPFNVRMERLFDV